MLTANQSKPVTPKQAAYRFFFANAGYSYDPKTQTRQQGRAATARKLAKAERDARALGYRFEWVEDYAANASGEYPDAVRVESCLLWAPDGKDIVGYLSGIDDATAKYRRVVEAELALEELG